MKKGDMNIAVMGSATSPCNSFFFFVLLNQIAFPSSLVLSTVKLFNV